MTKKPLILSGIAVLCAVTAAGGLFFAHAAESDRGKDATGKLTEAPSVMFTGTGDVSVRFAAENSPRLTKWWNGRVVMNCPVGYRFHVSSGTGSPHSGLQHEQATCEPNAK